MAAERNVDLYEEEYEIPEVYHRGTPNVIERHLGRKPIQGKQEIKEYLQVLEFRNSIEIRIKRGLSLLSSLTEITPEMLVEIVPDNNKRFAASGEEILAKVHYSEKEVPDKTYTRDAELNLSVITADKMENGNIARIHPRFAIDTPKGQMQVDVYMPAGLSKDKKLEEALSVLKQVKDGTYPRMDDL
jgi:hypothetical protein